MANLGSPEVIFIIILFLLLFGVERLPKLARSLGQAKQEFHEGVQDAARPRRDGEIPVKSASDIAARAEALGLATAGVSESLLRKRVETLESLDE